MDLSAFTKQARQVMRLAVKFAEQKEQRMLGTEYILLGMLRERSGVAGQILRQLGTEADTVWQMVDGIALPAEGDVLEKPGPSPETREILQDAGALARQYGSRETGTEHLLLSMIRRHDCSASQILANLGIDVGQVYAEILVAMGREEEFSREKLKQIRTGKASEKGSSSLLDKFSTDLTAQAAAGELDPLIGREAELQRIIQILSRRGKNNPCLIGEPGVGKTAIVEGLAQYIAREAVPEHLLGKRILTLDVPGMVAGTKYRGEFEERMKGIIREVQNCRNVILFIDELHTIIGAGGAEGSLDAANILKPALSRGTVHIIGATTVEEYRKHIEKDAALERRFQSVSVEEPDVEQTVEILRGLKSRYEKHHQVVISEEGIRAAAELSARYISGRFLPDKAIDLMDEAASKMHLAGFEHSGQLMRDREQMQLLQEQMETAIASGDIAEASRLHQERQALQETLGQMVKKYHRKLSAGGLTVGENEVADVVSAWTHIPVKRLTENETSRLKRMEGALHKRVIAQDEAVSAVAKAVRRGRVGLKDPTRPIGSFLFLGPTGVGKTEISKALAQEVFGTEDAMIRVDMSEYMEKHSVSRMIGSPPGYVGYDEGGQLSEQVRRHPYSVILFDEIEKAHPDVFNILLQVLDDGHITDSQGRKVDFKNTIIIMTSNAGAQSIIEPKKLGFAVREDEKADYERMKSNVMEEVRRIFKPEFLNRIDEIIVFHALTKDHMKKIVSLMTGELQERCKNQLEISLHIRDSVKKYIVEKSYNPKYGARPLRRMIQTKLEDALADEILSGNVKRGDTVRVTVRRDQIIFEAVKEQ